MNWPSSDRCRITATHRPSGERVVLHGRSLHKLKLYAIKILRGRLSQPPPPKREVRRYDVGGICGTHIRDQATGEWFKGDELFRAVMDRGELGRVRSIRG